MELFEQIRRELEFGVGTIAGVSRKLGVHRRMVREALRSAEPAASKPQRRRLPSVYQIEFDRGNPFASPFGSLPVTLTRTD